VKTYNNRGYSYAKSGVYDLATADYAQVIALDPGNAHAYHNRGISYDKLGQLDKAIADFTKGACVSARADGVQGLTWCVLLLLLPRC
jgi:Flp pilus assembly protein TadD